MQRWNVTVRKGGNVNSCRLVEGMSVEIITDSSQDPRLLGSGCDAIAKAFSEKYGFSERNVRGMNIQYQFDATKL